MKTINAFVGAILVFVALLIFFVICYPILWIGCQFSEIDIKEKFDEHFKDDENDE